MPASILVVDDMPDNLRLLRSLLLQEGYKVRPASSGAEALAAVAASKPDLILLDIKMPGMDGFEVCRRLQQDEQTKTIPIIFVTASADLTGLVKGFKLGAVDYITKPFNEDELRVRVRTHIELYQMREHLQRLVELRTRDLQQSENKYRTLFESSSDAIMLLDEYVFIDCNAATLKMFGCATRDEFLNCHPGELSPSTQPDGRGSKEAADEKIALAYQTGSNFFEWTHRRSTGEDFPAEVLLTRLTLDGKDLLQATVRDITERKLAEEEIHKSEKKFRTYIEKAPLAVFVTDMEGRFMDVNPKTAELLGYETSALKNMSIVNIYSEEDRVAILRALETLRQSGYVEGEFRIKRSDGTSIWVLLNINAIEGAMALGFCNDITERKRAEAAIEASEERHRLLFESSRDALMTLTPPSWRFTDANQATLELFGAGSVAEFTALGPWSVSPERQDDGRPSDEKAQEMIATAMREGKIFFEWMHQRLDGSPFAADVLLTRMEAGGEVFLQATVRDISERK